MKLHTKHFGEVNIREEDIIVFEYGLPAFEEEREFVLLPFGQETAFHILQSIHTSPLAFIVTDPFSFFPDYEVVLSDNVIEQLSLEKEEDVAVLSVLTVQDPFKKTTANLQAPIILNSPKKIAKQYVMNDSIYSPKHYLFPQEERSASGMEGDR
ncbi:flagellar assembly protein FliW [Alteribacillus iranensis]|uniref:Flagellar assembly factor FliW n=1 Tax=Alteribacillus iranensis TaxID=930128 RepID=A0A1I2EIJ8_9BACI|nr:flagellar assembly protein FliW [Alteribacillus iranensis]SFE92792.1 flagellar assembly factor FliW [Alteribacillus iranensis]